MYLSPIREIEKQCYASTRDKYDLRMKMQLCGFGLRTWTTVARCRICSHTPRMAYFSWWPWFYPLAIFFSTISTTKHLSLPVRSKVYKNKTDIKSKELSRRQHIIKALLVSLLLKIPACVACYNLLVSQKYTNKIILINLSGWYQDSQQKFPNS